MPDAKWTPTRYSLCFSDMAYPDKMKPFDDGEWVKWADVEPIINDLSHDGPVAELVDAYELALTTLENARKPATPEQDNAINYCITIVRGNMHRYVEPVRSLIEGGEGE